MIRGVWWGGAGCGAAAMAGWDVDLLAKGFGLLCHLPLQPLLELPHIRVIHTVTCEAQHATITNML